ncbi:MAG: flagellar biosynthesis protein FlhB [Candidatus Margulisiibacteriota bacterium]
MAEGGDKSEEPTPHRLREAREKGQIAKSKEVTTAVLLLFTYAMFRYLGEYIWSNLADTTQILFQLIPQAKEFDIAFAGYILLIALRGMAFVLLPIFISIFIVSFITESMQTGFVFAADPLSPKGERINPIEGFKRMFSMQGLVELVKSMLKIFIVFYIAWYAVKDELPKIVGLIESEPWDGLLIGGNIVYTIAMRVGIFYIIIAILDYFYKRWEYMRNLKMTKQEIKEEYKRLEGDPMVKQRMRDLQRQVAQQRMMAAVPQADVVVTNPTHIAVALKYDQKKGKAPILLAKGERKIAEEIKRIAEAHEITIIENVVLARSIYKTTRVNKEVPSELYQAIAEVLAYVYKIKQDRASRKKASIALSPR